MYDFDKVIERRRTGCVKYDVPAPADNPDLIPMWVADMDFEVLPEIKDALKQRVDHGIFGYSFPTEDYYNSVVGWIDRRHNWKIEKDWIVPMPGVVPALRICVQALTNPGDSVMIFKPVYYPFDKAVVESGRRLVEVPLKFEEGQYHLDLEAAEKAAKENDVKMIIFCSPHNPIGRVWTKEELQALGRFCLDHDIMLVSDEIHMDFTRNGHVHYPILDVMPELAQSCVVCTAPSKTFNLAALQTSNIITPNPKFKEKLQKQMSDNGVSSPNVLGLAACQAAYEHGDQWVDELNAYLSGNVDYLSEWLKEHLPEARVVNPEGLYLIWVDFNCLGLEPKELEKFMLEEAGLWLDEGYIFGQGGEGFERFNVACPRATLKKALDQLEQALTKRGFIK